MFAIVDIETCGSKFEYKKGRITDICVVVHDGMQIVEVWSSLINPDCFIPPFYTRLTGISNQMVSNAPYFHEVAAKIIELTENRVFIAHNVSFDYSFIRDEFASLGYRFERQKLCTLSLSRKLIPGIESYSLGNLCESLGIENKARHRAEGDAVATAHLFDLLLQAKAVHPQYKNMGVDQLMAKKVDKMKPFIINKLPEACGVYYFINKDREIIYIGKSLNMHQRAISHFNNAERNAKRMLHEIDHVDFTLTGSEIIALLLESTEIKKYKPKYNKQRINDLFNYCIDWHKDKNQIITLNVVSVEDSINPLQAFVSKVSATEMLNRICEENALCMNYCGLSQHTGPCFHYQIKKCKGICAGVEDADTYNKRAEKVIALHRFPNENFVVFGKGRSLEEESFLLFERNRYVGYGYVDASLTVNQPEEWKDYLFDTKYYPDHDVLLRSWLLRNKPKKIIW